MKKVFTTIFSISFYFITIGQGYYGVQGNEVYIIVNGATYQAGSTINISGSGPFTLQNIFVKTEKWVRNGGTSNVCGGSVSWNIPGGNSGSSTLSFDSNLGSVGNNDIQQWASAPNAGLSFPCGTSSISLSFGITGREGGTDCGQIKTSGFSFSSILPVIFEDFKIVNLKNTNLLSWQTHSETNHSHYEVERSSNAQNWFSISKVKADLSRSSSKTYEYLDIAPLLGRNYYRIKQVDLDGTISYSEIRSVHLNLEKDKLIVFPNPSTDRLIKIEYFSKSNIIDQVHIYNQVGQTIYSKEVKANEIDESINLSTFSPGLYFLSIRDYAGQVLEVQKLMLR